MVDQSVADIDAGMVDVVKADIFAVVARPDFHHRDHPLELPVQFDVALHDDGVGQEGVAVGAEAQHRITVFQLGGHHDGHAHGREYRDHAIQRFAEIFAEYRRQCQFEAGQRVDDDALACIETIILTRSCRISSIDRSSVRVSITPTSPALTILFSAWLSSWFGLFSNAAMTPGSPRRTPSARNCVASTVLPEPDGPTTSSE